MTNYDVTFLVCSMRHWPSIVVVYCGHFFFSSLIIYQVAKKRFFQNLVFLPIHNFIQIFLICASYLFEPIFNICFTTGCPTKLFRLMCSFNSFDPQAIIFCRSLRQKWLSFSIYSSFGCELKPFYFSVSCGKNAD